ncbi:phosphate/phosphite/phosphonate ABC transporter substrate-binding protein [Tahibacter amnicola]|uniref:PhnD/SsuA/transferrin family substrate-binding protein n=1 Tax=Tahibacter amnicola TaxID=2976241 RepID=A0ABY6BEC1_9GAMM|nr:PhnD/SsuA/transferrin family substrate-binding protein [Tahibacter amnicola]UXI68132.1 PhnD/SsuA/transferrin family substrate-binding protein [Tahibacter amnicola]
MMTSIDRLLFRTRALRRQLVRLAVAGVAACLPFMAQGEEPAVVVATYHYARYDRAAALQPLARHLADTLGRPVTVHVSDSPRALARSMAEGSVDIAITNTFVHLATRALSTLKPVAVFDVPQHTLERYRGVLIGRKDGPVTHASDLANAKPGIRYVQTIPGSTSGGLVQDLHLAAIGAAHPFGQPTYAGTHEAVLEQVRQAQADLGALAEPPWQKWQAENSAVATEIVELWRSPPIPPGPVVCRTDAAIDCTAVADTLLALDKANPAALAALTAAWSEASGTTRLRPVDESAYDALVARFRDAQRMKAVLEQLL